MVFITAASVLVALVAAPTLEMPSPEGRVDLAGLLQLLGERGVTSILVEGGGILFGSLFDARFIDKVIGFISPIIIGGVAARTAVAGQGTERVAESLKLERIGV